MPVSARPNLPLTVPPEPVWRLSVEQYHQIIRAGILTKDDPIELLEGWLIQKTPKNPRHRAATKLRSRAKINYQMKENRRSGSANLHPTSRYFITTQVLTRDALEAIVPQEWYVDSQEPITLSDSEPEPDVLIVRGDTRDYLDRHPTPADLGLVVEIADATLERDRVALRMQYRSLKKRLYARAGISVYWIVNLPQQQLEVYTQPNNSAETPTYQQSQIYRLGEGVTVAIAGQTIGQITVNDLLPAAINN